MRPVVIAEDVSKKFSRHPERHRNYGVRDLVREIFGRSSHEELRTDEFWAVRDVTFQLNEGESLALIGRNGAGKSTLLKMIGGLLKPDTGQVMVRGNVQALINLGIGFNANLSGLENIHNSAALLGLNGKRIRSIVDAVVDFAELEEFIESPVATYSTGMRARLGFSLAVHLNPDILLVDEVLSVGDFSFKNKCFLRLHELKNRGVSLLFVSHSHTHVLQLCDRALWLHKGRSKGMGPSKEVVQAYLDFLEDEEKERIAQLDAAKREASRKRDAARAVENDESLYGPIYDEADLLEDLRVDILVDERPVQSVKVHDTVTIEYGFTLKRPVTDLNVTLSFFREDGIRVSSLSTLNGDVLKHVKDGAVECRVVIPDFNLNPGPYVLVMPVHDGKSYLYRGVVKYFTVRGNTKLTWDFVDFKYSYSVSDSVGNEKLVSFEN